MTITNIADAVLVEILLPRVGTQRTVIHCPWFDFPATQSLALLVSNKEGIEKNLEKLGFHPAAYSPHFSLVDEATVAYCHERQIKIVPWTVNEVSDFERMKIFDLDGIITDYPDRAVKVFRAPKK